MIPKESAAAGARLELLLLVARNRVASSVGAEISTAATGAEIARESSLINLGGKNGAGSDEANQYSQASRVGRAPFLIPLGRALLTF